MRIDATSITDGSKKNQLILFAREIGCKAVYNPKTNGLEIEAYNQEKVLQINKKMEELKE